jgi:hypothetical protein
MFFHLDYTGVVVLRPFNQIVIWLTVEMITVLQTVTYYYELQANLY